MRPLFGLHLFSIDTTTYISPNHDQRPSGITPSAVIVHSCEGKPAGQERTSSLPWLCAPHSKVSAHYYVCRNALIYRLVDDTRRAWHAGAGSIAGDDPNDVSIGIELEHASGSAPYPAIQFRALGWLVRRLVAQWPAITPGRILSHRIAATPPGRKRDPSNWPEAEFRAWVAGLFYTHEPIEAYTGDSPILGTPHATAEQCAAWLIAYRPTGSCYTDSDVRKIAGWYFEQAAPLGVDPVLALAQMAHETGALGSFWSQRPQRNPAGVGVTGTWRHTDPQSKLWAFNTQRNRWEYGVSFRDWEHHAIPAHLGRLLAYATTQHQRSPAQGQAVVKALAYRSLPSKMFGSAPTLRQLGAAYNPTGQGWATPGRDYADRIASIANLMTKAQP